MMSVSQKIKMVNIKDILPNPYQTRCNFRQKELVYLCESIKNSGIISPVLLRASLNGYEIICGQRRIIAAEMANMESVPAIIIRATDSQCAMMSLEENMCRENLTKYEEAEGIYNLMSYHNIKKEKIINEFFENSAKLSKKMKILRFTERERQKIEEYKIDEDIAEELLKIHDDESRFNIIEAIKARELRKNEISDIIRHTQKELSADEKLKSRKKRRADMVLFKNTVKNTINILERNGAKTETEEKETEKYVEYTIKVYK